MVQGTLELSSMPSVSAVSGAASLRVMHVTQARIQLGWPGFVVAAVLFRLPRTFKGQSQDGPYNRVSEHDKCTDPS